MNPTSPAPHSSGPGSLPPLEPVDRFRAVDCSLMPNAVLIVDDEPVIRDVLAQVLTLEGYRVIQATNGRAAISAIAADRAIMDVITPGSHGSTFGGNPLAAAIGTEVVAMLEEGTFQARAVEIGALIEAGFAPLIGKGLCDVRVRGAWAGIDIDPTLMSGRQMSEALMERGILAKDTHGSTVRFAPPLVASDDDIALLVAAVADILAAG